MGDNSSVRLNNLTSGDLGLYRVEVKLSDGSTVDKSKMVVVRGKGLQSHESKER